MKNSKKGFTLVELIIVVAVIALLAAVLIPTFSSLISKANQAKDEALVSNLNKAVALSTEKYDNVHDVLDAVKANAGFDVAKISASVSEHEILWDSVNYCFVYKTEKGITGIPDTQTNKDVKDYQYWQFLTKEMPALEDQQYSIYWAGETIKTTAAKPLEVKVGFDAGKTTVAELKYVANKSEQDVILYTNGGNLTIDAETDSVEHFGTSDKVIVDAVAPNSYHENGDVVALVVSKGRVVVNQGATINTIIAKTTSTEVIVPKGSDTIVYAPEEVKVEGVEKKGTPDVVADNIDGVVTGAKYFAGGSGVEADPYLINNEEQLIKNVKNVKITMSMSMQQEKTAYYKLIADVVITNEVYLSGKTYIVDLNGHTIRLEYADGVKPNNGGVFNIAGKSGNLTINDSSEAQTGAVIGSNKTYTNKVTSAVRVGNYGKLTINGGHFYGTSEGTSCIFVYTSMSSGSKATVTINGGIFETATPSGGKYFVLNHQDNATGGCTITVNGGKFKNYNPSVTTVDPVNAKTGKIVLGEGCTTTETTEGKNTWYTVSK